jgi:DNA modification methylase
MNDEKFDFMFTDPPYKLAYTKNKRFKGYVKTKKGFGFRGQHFYLGVEKRGGVPEFDEWLKLANEYQNPDGANIMVFENWRNTPELWQAMEKYWKIKNMVIWHCAGRTQGFSRKYLFYNKYDIALLAENKPKQINDEFEEAFEEYLENKGEKLLNTYQVAVFGQKGDSTFNRKKGTATAKVVDHITWNVDSEKQSGQNLIFGTKPIPILIAYLKVLSDPNEIIMEPFGGSGSTLIASEILQRKCRLIEIEPLYAEVIIRRWEKFTGQKAKKIG